MVNIEKQKNVLIQAAYYGLLLLGLYLALRYLLRPLLPFFIGFLVACVLRRPTKFVANKCHIKGKLPAILLTAIFYLLAAALVILAGVQIVSAVSELLPRLPDWYTEHIAPLLERSGDAGNGLLHRLFPSLGTSLDSLAENLSASLSQSISTGSAALLKALSRLVTGMPMAILKVVLTIIATFFISVDYENIRQAVLRFLPQKVKSLLKKLRDKALDSLKVFAFSYTLLFLLTFTELSVGFAILRIPHPVGIGALVAVVDIMPVLGTGTVLLPWALIAAVLKNAPLAIGLVLLYIVITAIRNFTEPKLVGGQIGLHPLATLMSMFLGMQLCGILGIFLFPVGLSLAVQLLRDGVITLPWKRDEKK